MSPANIYNSDCELETTIEGGHQTDDRLPDGTNITIYGRVGWGDGFNYLVRREGQKALGPFNMIAGTELKLFGGRRAEAI